MGQISHIELPQQSQISPLVLCDRLLTLAQEADRGGFVVAAEHLLFLANEVLESPAALRA